MYIGDEIRMRYVKKYIPQVNPADKAICLDVGCGDKLYKDVVVDAGYKWYGIDINPFDSEVLRLDVEQINIGTNFYDLILCIDVLEHLHNPQLSIFNLSCLLKTGGTLIIHTPNSNQTHILVVPKKNEEHVRDGFQSKELYDLLAKDFIDIKIIPTFAWNEALAWDLAYTIQYAPQNIINLINTLSNFNAENFRNYGWLVKARKK